MEQLALAVLVVALCSVFGTRWFLLRDRPRPVAATPSTASGGELVELSTRVSALEAKFPGWKIEMEQLADQASDILDAAERKRRSARLAQTRAEQRAGGHEGEEPLGNGEQLGHPAQPLDPGQARAAILYAVRQRRGQR